jgi:hypothetical protein
LRLATFLLPLVALAEMSVAPEDRNTLPSRPYLAALGPTSLRFAEALPPVDLSVRPVVAAPTPPAGNPEPASAPKPESAANEDSALPPAPVQSPLAAVKPPETPAPSILPDETRPKVRPEDFLPYFQFPANRANTASGTVVSPGALTPPAPPTQPLSSATYQQQ